VRPFQGRIVCLRATSGVTAGAISLVAFSDKNLLLTEPKDIKKNPCLSVVICGKKTIEKINLMKFHVLAGDALAGDFKETKIAGETIVCREALVDGSVKAANLEEFWKVRAEFMANSHDAKREDYFETVAAEFAKLQRAAAAGAEINLWFEYELFCQVNFWFCLSLIGESTAKIFRVAPVTRKDAEIWKGFGGLAANDLEKCFAGRTELSEADRLLGARLWQAFQNADFQTLGELSATDSASFPHLNEVCRAAIEQNSRPPEILRQIIKDGKTGFGEIFTEFSAQAGVYGFGDTQVKGFAQKFKEKGW
jgi:hypothetical protein